MNTTPLHNLIKQHLAEGNLAAARDAIRLAVQATIKEHQAAVLAEYTLLYMTAANDINAAYQEQLEKTLSELETNARSTKKLDTLKKRATSTSTKISNNTTTTTSSVSKKKKK
jgi:hypothetical protein